MKVIAATVMTFSASCFISGVITRSLNAAPPTVSRLKVDPVRHVSVPSKHPRPDKARVKPVNTTSM